MIRKYQAPKTSSPRKDGPKENKGAKGAAENKQTEPEK